MADIKKSTLNVSLYSFLKYFENNETNEVIPSVVKKEEKIVSSQKINPTRPDKGSSSQSFSIIPASQLIASTSVRSKRESRCIKKETLFQCAMDKYIEKTSISSEVDEDVTPKSIKPEDETSRSSEEIDPDFASVLDLIVSNQETNRNDSLQNSVKSDLSGHSSEMGFQKSSTLLNNQNCTATKQNHKDNSDMSDLPDRFSVSNLRAKYFGFETHSNENFSEKSNPSTDVDCKDFVKIKEECSSTSVNDYSSSPTLNDFKASIKIEDESSSSANDSKNANLSQSINDLNKINALKRKNQGNIYAGNCKEERSNGDIKSESANREYDYTDENKKFNNKSSIDSNKEQIISKSPVEIISDSDNSIKVEECSGSKDSETSSKNISRRAESKMWKKQKMSVAVHQALKRLLA